MLKFNKIEDSFFKLKPNMLFKRFKDCIKCSDLKNIELRNETKKDKLVNYFITHYNLKDKDKFLQSFKQVFNGLFVI